MIISGLVIDVAPDAGASALAALQRRSWVARVEGPVSPGRLVAVVTAEDNSALDALMDDMLTTPGIIGVSPAFIHFDA
ncbi:MAG TPA: chaperone NapD [Symbiobacteriaceae bacterium]|nr:chaperone NapD [Symbiobacteriaceae bacterium]